MIHLQFVAFPIRLTDEHLPLSAIGTLISSGAMWPVQETRGRREVFTMLGSILMKASNLRGACAKATIGACAAALASLTLPAHAQEMETFDPDAAFETVAPAGDQAAARNEAADVAAQAGAIDADIEGSAFRTAPALDSRTGTPSQSGFTDGESGWDGPVQTENWGTQAPATAAPVTSAQPVPQWSTPSGEPVVANAAEQSATYGEDDLIGAAEGVFGKGAKGLAGLIEDLLRKQGEPNGYIVGREAGGAFIFGARYGSGTLHHKVEGQRQVYWTGPSLGFDAGANAGNTFVLVYNLFDSEDIFKRYPAGEGQAYLVGGLHASYMRRGDVVLIPIRVGAGLRLGVNAGYMRFSKKHRWLPF